MYSQRIDSAPFQCSFRYSFPAVTQLLDTSQKVDKHGGGRYQLLSLSCLTQLLKT